MLLKTRVQIIVLASLIGLLIMGGLGLYSMRTGLIKERRAQIAQLLDFANAQLRYFHGLEVSGKLTREEAQLRAKEAIAAQRQGDNNYFFIRALKSDVFVYHPITDRIGKEDNGGYMPDGRSVAQANRDALARSSDNKAFVDIRTLKPGSGDQKLYPKMNGILKFEPWEWMVGIGFYADDIDTQFWRQSQLFLAIGVVIFVLTAFLVFKMRRSIISLLGGEPRDAAKAMKSIAGGELNVDIPVKENDNNSLMASLKVMQLKLINLTTSIQENATSLSEQIQTFGGFAKSYTENKSDETLADLMRSVRKIGKTTDVLQKSIARIKL